VTLALSVDVFREEDARGKGLKSLNAAVDTDPEELEEDIAIGLGTAATPFEVRLVEVASSELMPTAAAV
jgi:hypothetical protein